MKRKSEISKESKDILDDGVAISELVKSQGWQIIKKKLIRFIGANTSVLSLNMNDRDTLLTEIASRQMASNILLEWLNEVEGDARQHESNKTLLQESIESEYMTNY